MEHSSKVIKRALIVLKNKNLLVESINNRIEYDKESARIFINSRSIEDQKVIMDLANINNQSSIDLIISIRNN